MRVFIADLPAITRLALTFLLELEPGLEIVGEAGTVAELLPGLAAARPDVLLLEWTLIHRPLAEVLADIHAQVPHLYVIVLSARPEVQRTAHAAGADAFVSKGDPPHLLLTALRQVQAARRL
jgi:DNA-binding NarL/FixJ family response regulator